MKTIVLIARVVTVLILALFILRSVASAQQPAQTDMIIDASTRTAVIESLIKELNDGYVFPDTAKKIESDLRSRVSNKEYDSVTGAKAFVEKLTADVQSVSHDKHMRVRYS